MLYLFRLFTKIIFLTVFFYGYGIKGYASLRLSGDLFQIAIPATAIGTTFVLKDFKGSREFANGFIATSVTTYGLKYAFDERRPCGKKHSFPSGHTAIAFYGSGFIHHRYGWQYAVPAYTAALLVGYSRIKIKEHWFHDVIGGAAIGLLYSSLLTTPYHNRSYHLYPVLTPESVAIHCEGPF